MAEIFGNSTIFENPKPLGLIDLIIELGTHPDFIGDGLFLLVQRRRAHAALNRNAADGGNEGLCWSSCQRVCPMPPKLFKQVTRRSPTFPRSAFAVPVRNS